MDARQWPHEQAWCDALRRQALARAPACLAGRVDGLHAALMADRRAFQDQPATSARVAAWSYLVTCLAFVSAAGLARRRARRDDAKARAVFKRINRERERLARLARSQAGKPGRELELARSRSVPVRSAGRHNETALRDLLLSVLVGHYPAPGRALEAWEFAVGVVFPLWGLAVPTDIEGVRHDQARRLRMAERAGPGASVRSLELKRFADALAVVVNGSGGIDG